MLTGQLKKWTLEGNGELTMTMNKFFSPHYLLILVGES